MGETSVGNSVGGQIWLRERHGHLSSDGILNKNVSGWMQTIHKEWGQGIAEKAGPVNSSVEDRRNDE